MDFIIQHRKKEIDNLNRQSTVKQVKQQTQSIPQLVSLTDADNVISKYNTVYIVKPFRNNMNITLKKPQQDMAWIMIKDIANSSKYTTTIVCDDKDVTFDNDSCLELNGHDCISLKYSKELNKFLIV